MGIHMIFYYLTVASAFLILASAAKPKLKDYHFKAVRQELLDEVNSRTYLWKAAVPIRFENATVAEVKRQLGTFVPRDPEYVAPLQSPISYSDVKDTPESFDARKEWPECAHIIGHVRDQSNCGSCWAFSSTESFNDRYCIMTKDYKTFLSPEDTNSCCHGLFCGLSQGCNGGQPDAAWHWFTKSGVSTGGDYSNMDDGSSCKPYSFEACAHHSKPPEGMKSCDEVPSERTVKCVSSCSDKYYDSDYSKDKHYASKSYLVIGEEHMKRSLLEKGSLSVAIEVYEDFELYQSGIYHHVTGSYLGGHAIKLIGWGVEEGTPYWICINSWNTMWGEDGSFRILRGKNEVGIETTAVAGDVHV